MAEIFRKNHNFFLFFNFLIFFFPQVAKFRQKKKKPLLLVIENLQNHLIIILISKNGGNNPYKITNIPPALFFHFLKNKIDGISPSCEISPEKNKIKPLHLAIGKPTKSPNFRNFQSLIWLFAEIFPNKLKKQRSSKSLRKYVRGFFFPKLLAHTSFATNLALEEDDDEDERRRRRLSSSLGGRQDDDPRRRRSRPDKLVVRKKGEVQEDLA